MGSPVSAIVANLCVEVIEEQAIQSATKPPKTWKRFVDDSLPLYIRMLSLASMTHLGLIQLTHTLSLL